MAPGAAENQTGSPSSGRPAHSPTRPTPPASKQDFVGLVGALGFWPGAWRCSWEEGGRGRWLGVHGSGGLPLHAAPTRRPPLLLPAATVLFPIEMYRRVHKPGKGMTIWLETLNVSGVPGGAGGVRAQLARARTGRSLPLLPLPARANAISWPSRPPCLSAAVLLPDHHLRHHGLSRGAPPLLLC